MDLQIYATNGDDSITTTKNWGRLTICVNGLALVGISQTLLNKKVQHQKGAVVEFVWFRQFWPAVVDKRGWDWRRAWKCTPASRHVVVQLRKCTPYVRLTTIAKCTPLPAATLWYNCTPASFGTNIALYQVILGTTTLQHFTCCWKSLHTISLHFTVVCLLVPSF